MSPCLGCLEGLTHRHDALPAQTVGLKQIGRNSPPLDFQVPPDAQIAEAEPVQRVQPCSHPHGAGAVGTRWLSQLHPSSPKWERGHPSQRYLLHCPPAQISLPGTGGEAVLAREGAQDESRHGTGSGWWQLCQAHSRGRATDARQALRVEAPIILALGTF